jgi:hypothetical protein
MLVFITSYEQDSVWCASLPQPPVVFFQLSQGVLLRRTKATTINDEPIVKIPPRDQQLVQQEFTREVGLMCLFDKPKL